MNRFAHRSRLTAATLALAIVTNLAMAGDDPVFVDVPSGTIDCATTPFGLTARALVDAEPLFLQGQGSNATFDEYRAAAIGDPLEPVYRASIGGANGAGARNYRKAINVDLNGDGRDEVVVAYSSGSDIVLAVFKRTSGLSPSVERIDTWTYTEAMDVSSIDLAAGDFDGSRDGKQELAIVWSRTAASTMRVSFLTGHPSGTINEADQMLAGTFINGFQSSVPPKLATGDFLLANRDQVVLTGERPSPRALIFEMIMFQPDDPAFQPTPANSHDIGRVWFEHSLSSGLFALDDENSILVGPIQGIAVAAGDVTDTAADELVIQISTETTRFARNSWSVLERLLQFTAVRDDAGAITAVTLPVSGYDASRRIEHSEDHIVQTVAPPSIALTIADLDGLPPREIVRVRAGGSHISVPLPNNIAVASYGAGVRLAADFRYVGVGTDRTVQFISTAVGDIARYEWSINGQPFSTSPRPVRRFDTSGEYPVLLRVFPRDGSPEQTSLRSVNVQQTTVAGGGDAPVRYRFTHDPARSYAGTLPTSQYSSGSMVALAVADIDNDHRPEILTIARGGPLVSTFDHVNRIVWRPGIGGTLTPQSTTESGTFSAVDVLSSDFDGNSLHALISGDCRRVTDNLIRTLTWQPPYFSALQDGAWKAASYGRNVGGASSHEQRAGRYFSSSLSGYIGASTEIGPFGVKIIETSLKVTASQSWQRENGVLHGRENEYTLSEGAVHSGSSEALVQTESHQSDCYKYDLFESGDILADSHVRMCEVIHDGSEFENTSALVMNNLTNQTPPVQVPMHWVPMQRDWASLALFRPVASNASFAAGSSADRATDGRFGTAAESFGRSLQPYLQIDLGSVQDISAIRVFPKTGEVSKLWGYRVYTSEQPFTGTAVPGGSSVTQFQQDTGVEAVYREWNIWTRNPGNPNQPLRARYLRIQHPGNDPVAFSIAEIQVFGETHAEPPTYPESVCDNITGDGVFYARVWNPVAREYRSIELLGDLIWTGSPAENVNLPNGNLCDNDNETRPVLIGGDGTPAVARYSIWNGLSIGGDATTQWSLDTSTTETQGTYTSLDDSHNVGVEWEFGIGVGTMLVAGAAVEFGTGVTRESQSSTAWTEGFSIGGEIEGFGPNNPLASACRYFPRPYAFRQTSYSNGGFKQAMYVTDYTVRQTPHGTAWQRDQNLSHCLTGELSDVIFANGFQ